MLQLSRLAGSLVAGVLYLFLGDSLPRLEAPLVEPPEEGAHEWDPRLFQALTFGHWPSGIDWFWLRALQDSPGVSAKPAKHSAVYYRLKLAIDLDSAYW